MISFTICFLQEHEFLKNYVQRIADVRPNLVLVEKTVSRIAQDMLLEHGISLVINVKPVSIPSLRHCLNIISTLNIDNAVIRAVNSYFDLVWGSFK